MVKINEVSPDSIKYFALKNWTIESKEIVEKTMNTLKDLINEWMDWWKVFYELAEKASSPNYRMKPHHVTKWKALNLVEQDWSIESSIKNVVLSWKVWELIFLTLGDPTVEGHYPINNEGTWFEEALWENSMNDE